MEGQFIFAMSAIFTGIIAIYAVRSYELSREIKFINDTMQKRDEDFKQQISDLYKAIVVATLLSGPTSKGDFGGAKDTFKAHYAGKTPIFKE